MAKEAFKFSGEDAINYDRYLGPLLFEPSALKCCEFLGSNKVEKVLEISAGTGRLTTHLRNYFPASTKLVVTDISADMLAIAKDKCPGPSIEFTVADAQKLPFEDASFDLVVCQYGIMFFPDKAGAFREAFRVLKPGGRFVFSTWDKTSRMPLLKLVFDDTVVPFFNEEDPSRFYVPFSLYEPSVLIALLESAGFSNCNISPVSFFSEGNTPENIVKGLFLKHALGSAVAAKNPDAVAPMAEKMRESVTNKFGSTNLSIELKALFCTGQK